MKKSNRRNKAWWHRSVKVCYLRGILFKTMICHLGIDRKGKKGSCCSRFSIAKATAPFTRLFFHLRPFAAQPFPYPRQAPLPAAPLCKQALFIYKCICPSSPWSPEGVFPCEAVCPSGSARGSHPWNSTFWRPRPCPQWRCTSAYLPESSSGNPRLSG